MQTPVADPVTATVTGKNLLRRNLEEVGRPLDDLFGAWLVETVAASQPVLKAEGHHMVLLVGVHQLEVLSQCVTIGPFDYGRAADGGIEVRQTPVVPRPGPAIRPPPQCARMHSPAERAMGPLLLAARDVRLLNDGTVSLSGPSGTLTVRRPSGALGNPHGAAPPPRVPPLVGGWRFVSVDGRRLTVDQPMELLLRPRRLEWRSGCVSDVKQLSIDRNVMHLSAADPHAVCERGRSQTEGRVERLLQGKVATRMAADGRLRLDGSGVTAELEPLTSGPPGS